MSNEPSFDLTRCRWLPVRMRDGSEQELSLREVIEQADEVRRLVGDVPTQEFALLRLLLAVVHDAIQGPTDLDQWQELWDGGLPVDTITGYLDDHRHRFDLLHPTAPFFQCPALPIAQDPGSLDRIVADVPNGVPFFTMRARGTLRLGFAEAARWVVHAHAYDTSGIKTGVKGDPRAKNGKVYPLGVAWAGNLGGVLIEGDTLQQTLLLNLIAFDTDNLRQDPECDLPAWRHPAPGPGQLEPIELSKRPAGVRDLYTWQSRRLRLAHDTRGVTGVTLGYGDPLAPHNMHQREPMTAWRRSPAQEKKLGRAQIYMAQEHDPTRSAWRGLGALIAGRTPGGEQRGEAAAIVRPRILDWAARLTVEGDLPGDFLIRPRLFGAVYGTQQSVIDEVIADSVTMPIVLLRRQDRDLGQAAIDAVADAEAAVRVLGDLAVDLARAGGAETEPARERARSMAFATVDGPFRRWLSELRPDDLPNQVRADWQRQTHHIVRRLGEEVLRDAGDAAWEGRVIRTAQGQELWLNAPKAELTFRDRLRKALPLALTDSPDQGLDQLEALK
jgi:CRISPR system Cascade subunit CasA